MKYHIDYTKRFDKALKNVISVAWMLKSYAR